MAVVFCESFDRVATIAQLSGSGRRWGFNGNTGSQSLVAGRTGSALRISNSGLSYIMVVFGSSTEIRLGFAYRTDTIAAGTKTIAAIHSSGDGTTTGGYTLNRVGATLDLAPNGSGAINPAATADVLTANTWHYIEWRYKHDGVNGAHELRVDRVLVHSSTGDTVSSLSDASIRSVRLGGDLTSVTHDYDDAYVTDTTDASGVGNTGYLGDVKIACKRPDGNGSYSDWVGSDGNSVDNYQLVDEQSTDDADYVESTVNGDKDTYNFEDATDPGGHVIKAVVQGYRIASLTGGNKPFRTVRKDAGAEAFSPDGALATPAMSDRFTVQEKSAADAAWASFAELNATEFGLEQRA